MTLHEAPVPACRECRPWLPMSDALLPYYDRELDAIKRLAAEFADTHPKIAGRLRLSADAVDDPHVARLLEGVAFLAARVHHRLDDEFPELTDALLGLLYPHYLAPVPSCMVAQFDCQPDLMNPARLPAGIAIDTEPVRGEELRFRTTAPVTLWPVEVENVRLSGLPIVAPANPAARRRRRRAAHHAEMRLARRHLHPARRRPAALLPARPDQPGAGAVRAAAARTPSRSPSPTTRWIPAPVIVPPARSSRSASRPTRRCCPGRRAASPASGCSPNTSPSRRSSCSSISRGSTPRPWCPRGNRLEIFVYLDRSLPELERTDRPAVAGARLHAAGQPVPASAASR